jgi:hypothetical protein
MIAELLGEQRPANGFQLRLDVCRCYARGGDRELMNDVHSCHSHSHACDAPTMTISVLHRQQQWLHEQRQHYTIHQVQSERDLSRCGATVHERCLLE